MFKKAKKIITALVVVAVMVSVISIGFTVGAAALPVFTVSDVVQARPGDNISVTVTVDENRGYCAGEFVLCYDPAALTPIGIEAGEAASEYFVANTEYASGEVFFAHISEELMSQAGTVATIDFTVNESVVLYSGDLELRINALVGNISVGYGLNNVKNTINSGKVFAARPISVPDANDSEQREELTVTNSDSGILVGGVSTKNISANSIASNFSSFTAKAFSRLGSSLREEQRLTTGCTVQIFDNDKAVSSFTVVVKADVNGDYNLDGEDAFIANLVASGAVSAEELGDAESSASDINGDGIIDESDIAALSSNGLSMPQ